MSPRLAALSCCTLLAACASAQGDYPSLAIREGERVSGTLEPAAAQPYVPPPTPAEVVGRLEQLSGEAAATHRDFLGAAPGISRTVSAARGSEVGSEAWAQAQVALANLDSIRSRAMIALADLDRLYVEAVTQGAEVERIAEARERVSQLVDAENAVIDELGGTLR